MLRQYRTPAGEQPSLRDVTVALGLPRAHTSAAAYHVRALVSQGLLERTADGELRVTAAGLSWLGRVS